MPWSLWLLFHLEEQVIATFLYKYFKLSDWLFPRVIRSVLVKRFPVQKMCLLKLFLALKLPFFKHDVTIEIQLKLEHRKVREGKVKVSNDDNDAHNGNDLITWQFAGMTSPAFCKLVVDNVIFFPLSSSFFSS